MATVCRRLGELQARWVIRIPSEERPERLMASVDAHARDVRGVHLQLLAGKVDRTRPLCPYPQVARYNGAGSIDEASNFTCRLLH